GSAQNPHGPAHGWFIGFAPADKPEIVVGAIVEHAQHGSGVAPLVARVIARYLGADTTVARTLRLALPTDTAPHARAPLPGPPDAYGATVLLLLVTLVVGTGAGTAAGSRSWLAIGGLRVGQPAELAKLAVILMLARWLAARREAPATLRDLLPPGVIVGVPFALVLLQPDLGSAVVFIAILFAMLFWAGTKPSLLVLLASPAIGLILAFSTV